uniref:Uncharacterized protein n=1 Tax=viral metagenome TaxID=1070528 RepID=A0A6C0BL53_9ZZZZ
MHGSMLDHVILRDYMIDRYRSHGQNNNRIVYERY